MSSEYAKANDVKLPSAQVTGADFGLSGKAQHQRETLPQIDLGDIQIKNIKTNGYQLAQHRDVIRFVENLWTV